MFVVVALFLAAIAVVAIEYDGVSAAKLVTGLLAPQAESPIRYENFLKRISGLYVSRFSGQ